MLIKSVLYQPVSLGRQQRFTTAITPANYNKERRVGIKEGEIKSRRAREGERERERERERESK